MGTNTQTPKNFQNSSRLKACYDYDLLSEQEVEGEWDKADSTQESIENTFGRLVSRCRKLKKIPKGTKEIEISKESLDNYVHELVEKFQSNDISKIFSAVNQVKQ